MESLTIFEQIRDISRKISHARIAVKQGNIERRNRVLRRAIKFIDLILKREFRAGCVREMNILRDVIQDMIDGPRLYDCSLESLENYCLPFALLARKPI